MGCQAKNSYGHLVMSRAQWTWILQPNQQYPNPGSSSGKQCSLILEHPVPGQYMSLQMSPNSTSVEPAGSQQQQQLLQMPQLLLPLSAEQQQQQQPGRRQRHYCLSLLLTCIWTNHLMQLQQSSTTNC
jgi:hypothetical protein